MLALGSSQASREVEAGGIVGPFVDMLTTTGTPDNANFDGRRSQPQKSLPPSTSWRSGNQPGRLESKQS